jgi:predicted nuclease of predicted toxin-antitoxin system
VREVFGGQPTPGSALPVLEGNGYESGHVLSQNMDEASDLEIWNYATAGNWIVVNKDEDFLHLANRLGDTGKLLWVRIGNSRKLTLLKAFERELRGIVRAFDEGFRVVEIR